MKELAERCFQICNQMRPWFKEQNYAGTDPYLLDEKFFFRSRRLPVVGSLVTALRLMLKPLHPYIPKRVFTSQSPVVSAKTLGLILSGNANLYRIDTNMEYLRESASLLELLKKERSQGFQHLCWGHPFSWGSTVKYPPHMPVISVASFIAHGIMDFYEVSQDEGLLPVLNDVAQYFMDENGYDDFKDALCLHYSPIDIDLIHNGNILGGSFLMRLAHCIHDEKMESFGSKIVNFTLQGQNSDGSWYYSDARGTNKLDTIIDNRHLGFILEYLHIIAELLRSENVYQAIDRGWEYYKNVLLDGTVPKWSPHNTYPVDIHDVAQSIITTIELGKLDIGAEIVEFAFSKFFDGHNQFYYKLFTSGRVNKTVFTRWGQAWMFKALSVFSERVLTSE